MAASGWDRNELKSAKEPIRYPIRPRSLVDFDGIKAFIDFKRVDDKVSK